jgi:HK97 family phage major capsid protein
MTQEFMSFNGVNFDAWLSNALARAESVTENSIFTTGTGTGAPQGVLVGATSSSITTAAAAAITPAELAQLIGKLGAGYNVPTETGFLMQNATKWYLKGLTGDSFVFVQTPQGAEMFGYPAFVSDDMEALAATKKAVLFGNFNFYGVVEKPGMMVQRNEYLYMASGQVALFAHIYRGGAVLQSEAFYYMTQHA